jgi:hypothetical protein
VTGAGTVALTVSQDGDVTVIHAREAAVTFLSPFARAADCRLEHCDADRTVRA